jgi:hypothetical protein
MTTLEDALEDVPNYTSEECDAFTEALKADPIIVAMYDEIFDDDKLRIVAGEYTDGQEVALALVAAAEYENRGGELDSHLGGPWDAIVSLAKEAAAV